MRMFLFVACLAFIALAAEAAIPQPSPEAAVRDVYAADALSLRDNGARRIQRSQRSAEALLALLASGDRRRCRIPADPFGDSSPHLVDLKVAATFENGAAATVGVDFARGDGAREHLTYALVLERREWRIDDIGYALLGGENRTLRGMISR